MRLNLVFFLIISNMVAVSMTIGCSDEADVEREGTHGASITAEIECEATAEEVYGTPGTLPENLGEIYACVDDGNTPVADLQNALDELGYSGAAVTSGMNVYRVSYTTTRGDGEPGYTSAIVFAPDTRRAEQLPVIVAAHGSRGQAENCAPSLNHADGAFVQPDFYRLVYPFVGMGYVVIAPDYAGYANYDALGNPPSVYAHALDAAQSTLDGVAAVRNLFPNSLSEDVIIVGHSLGGHTALAALAAAQNYGVDGTIVGVAVYAPLWISPLVFGSMYIEHVGFHVVPNNLEMTYINLLYHWSHAMFSDSNLGGSQSVFNPDLAEELDSWINETCWSAEYPGLIALMTEHDPPWIIDYLHPVLWRSIAGAIGPSVSSGEISCENPGVLDIATCERWLERYLADRPSLTGAALTTPIRLIYGNQDTMIPPQFMNCGIEKLRNDGVELLEICVETTDNHSSIMNSRAENVGQWIGHLTLGEEEPSDCMLSTVLGPPCGVYPNP